MTATASFSWHAILQSVKAHKLTLIKANLIAILAALVSVPLPLLLPLLVDEVLLQQPGSLLAILHQVLPNAWQTPVFYIVLISLLTIVLRVSALLLNVWQSRQFTYVSKDIVFGLRRQLLAKLQSVEMAEYETLGSGKVASFLVTDLETLDQFIGGSVSRFIVAALSIFGTAIILLIMHWQIATFILVFNPLVISITMALGKWVKRLKKNENKAFASFQEALVETLDGMQQIRALNRDGFYLALLTGKAEAVKQCAIDFAWKSEAASRFSFVVFLIGFDLFRAVAMVMVLLSDLTIGQMFAVFGYLWFMMGPVQEVLGIQYSFFGADAALKRINQLNHLRSEPDYPALHNPFKSAHTLSVAVRQLQFSYDNGRDVLRGIDFDVQQGEKVAFVGVSGGGKSTLVQLLIGMYQPIQGDIYYGGVPITEIGLPCVRQHVATVLQHPVLFNASIRDNLSMGHVFSDAQLWHALRIAQLESTVLQMAQTLDTEVGRHGVRLSGGQRQRLAIARMILAQPKVVILDEATSALDTETEFQLHQALAEYLQQTTTIIIAHRLSAVKMADRVYVFEDGLICQQGHHDELIQKQGLYAQLYGER